MYGILAFFPVKINYIIACVKIGKQLELTYNSTSLLHAVLFYINDLIFDINTTRGRFIPLLNIVSIYI